MSNQINSMGRRVKLATMGVLLVACGGALLHATERGPRLSNTAPSADVLIETFLKSLQANDADALRRLRVTESEYREIIFPGGVREGRPRKERPKEVADIAWGLLDTKSRYYEMDLLSTYGGKSYSVVKIDYEKGVHRYANHVAHKQLRLTLTDTATGSTAKLGTGSVVEIDGRYKFISFIND